MAFTYLDVIALIAAIVLAGVLIYACYKLYQYRVCLRRIYAAKLGGQIACNIPTETFCRFGGAPYAGQIENNIFSADFANQRRTGAYDRCPLSNYDSL